MSFLNKRIEIVLNQDSSDNPGSPSNTKSAEDFGVSSFDLRLFKACIHQGFSLIFRQLGKDLVLRKQYFNVIKRRAELSFFQQ